MAFAVTPTSGVVPYVFTANIINKLAFSLGLYALEFRASGREGSCPPPTAGGMNQQVVVDALLNNGTYTLTEGSVVANNCSRYNLIIRRLSDNEIIQHESVTVSNV